MCANGSCPYIHYALVEFVDIWIIMCVQCERLVWLCACCSTCWYTVLTRSHTHTLAPEYTQTVTVAVVDVFSERCMWPRAKSVSMDELSRDRRTHWKCIETHQKRKRPRIVHRLSEELMTVPIEGSVSHMAE